MQPALDLPARSGGNDLFREPRHLVANLDAQHHSVANLDFDSASRRQHRFDLLGSGEIGILHQRPVRGFLACPPKYLDSSAGCQIWPNSVVTNPALVYEVIVESMSLARESGGRAARSQVEFPLLEQVTDFPTPMRVEILADQNPYRRPREQARGCRSGGTEDWQPVRETSASQNSDLALLRAGNANRS